MTHSHPVRVYYEDTDLAGIVYYANYLKFIERARTEWVRTLGINQDTLRRDTGVVFAVRRVEADYLAPARFDDVLDVRTALVTLTPARILLAQTVWRGDMLLFQAQVTLVCLTARGTATRLPAALRARLTPA